MMRLYIIGLSILIFAILANAIIGKIGLKSWYDFFDLLNKFGWEAFRKLGVMDWIWLFILYPFMLGFGYFIGEKIFKAIF